MVPLTLRLRNFMCYRGETPPLHLEGVQVACLSGQNGHGKSALLDAMTWALWGESRAKSDDHLIHLGQSEMEVELEFRAADGEHYRVIRKRARPRRDRAGQTGLELHIIGGDGLARPITGNSVRETEGKLRELLRLDYETFINSAFLVQGRADAFTLKTPAERKQVLGDILGLAFYDALEEHGRELLREAEGRLAQHTRDLEELDRELQGREDLDALARQAQEDLERIQREHQAQELVANGLRQHKLALDLQVAQVAELDRRIAENQKAIAQYEAEAAEETATMARYEGVLARQADIQVGLGALLAARQARDEQARRLAEVRRLEQEAHRLERAMAEQRAALAGQIQVLRAELDGLRPKTEAIARLPQALARLDQETTGLAEARSSSEARQDRAQELSNQAHHLGSENNRLRKEMDELRAKLDQLVQAPGGTCPLCGTELGEDAKEHIAAQYQVEGQARRDQYRANEQERRSIEQELKALQTEIATEAQRVERETAALAARRATLERELEEGRRASERLAEAAPVLAEREADLAGNAFAQAEREALGRVQQRIADLDYDEAEHEGSAQRARELEPYEPLAREVEEAERLLPQAQERRDRASQRAATLQQQVKEDLQQREAVAAGIGARAQVEQDLAAAEAVLAELNRQVRQQAEDLGRWRQQQERLATLAQIRKDKREAQTEARREREVYGDLVSAFGKRGIQALVIEAALPELQDEANRLLGRMTDNRMSLTLETQRQTQRGSVVETLDIRVADELGTRDYELFSGGEAFRINFALRVALSRLLARRAGAPLPTLIVDEGFGTQDSAGREKLIEVLNAIQDDFERILVITHIEELKDLFPVRIEVVKTASGSTFTLVA